MACKTVLNSVYPIVTIGYTLRECCVPFFLQVSIDIEVPTTTPGPTSGSKVKVKARIKPHHMTAEERLEVIKRNHYVGMSFMKASDVASPREGAAARTFDEKHSTRIYDNMKLCYLPNQSLIVWVYVNKVSITQSARYANRYVYFCVRYTLKCVLFCVQLKGLVKPGSAPGSGTWLELDVSLRSPVTTLHALPSGTGRRKAQTTSQQSRSTSTCPARTWTWVRPDSLLFMTI